MKWAARGCLLVGICAFIFAADVCVRPPAIEKSLRLKPSAEGYTALGVWFAKQEQFACAFPAFEDALHLSPDSWLTHYDYALALTAAGHRDRAKAELREATALNPEFLDGHLALGEALKDQGSFEEAEREYRLALGIDRSSVPANDGLARILMAQRRFSAAIPWLQELVKLDPNIPRHRLDLGVAWAESGNYKESREVLQALVAAQPDLAEAHYNLAVAMAKERDFRGAATEYRACLAHDPGNDLARLSIAVVLHTVASDHEALPYAEEYVKRRPDDPRGLALLGSICRLTGRDEQAEKNLRRAAALAPADAEVRLDLGITLANLHRLMEAREQLEKARELNPNSEEVHFRLAGVYKDLNLTEGRQRELGEVQRLKHRKLSEDIGATTAARANQLLRDGDARGAADAYREALKTDPNDARTYYNLSLALKALGDAAGELEALKKSIELDGRLASARDRMGVLYMERGEIEHAAAEFQAAIAADPQGAEPMYNLGYLYGMQGKNDAAERLLRQTTENRPAYVDAWLMLARVMAAQGRFGDAEKPAETAQRLAPKSAPVLTMLGMIRTRLGRGEDALPVFREVVALEPAQSEAHLNLGIALADALNPGAAIVEFAEAARLAPQNPAAHYNLGRALFDVQQYDEAQRELDRTEQLEPRNGSALYLLALIERQRGNLSKAAQLLRDVISIEPSDSDAHFQLGRCLKELGQDERAIAEWRSTLQLKPGNKEAAYNLARALDKTAPEEARTLRGTITGEQKRQMAIDRASTLGNFALSAANERDWPRAVAHLKEALEICGGCNLQAQLRKDLGLTYARSGNLKDAVAELKKAESLAPRDADIGKALRVIRVAQESPPVAVP
jgi:tetratricopeptide (TPR) repeat protein